MSTAFAVGVSVVVALLCAIGMRWLDTRSDTRLDGAQGTGISGTQARCTDVLNTVFANGSGSLPDSILLARLGEHRDQCIGNATFVDQLRRLMVNTRQFDSARTLLDEADRRHTFAADERSAQQAWIDLGEAQHAWNSDDESRARTLHANAVAIATRLQAQWPEWSMPYRLLEEAGRADWATRDPRVLEAPPTIEWSARERAARGRAWNGAFARTLDAWQPIVVVFGLALLATLGLCVAVSGAWELRQISSTAPHTIADAPSGYVALSGKLALLPGTNAVIGPYSRQPGVWYEIERTTSFRGWRTSYEHSDMSFVLRDATGFVVIDPAGIAVRSSHTASLWPSSGSVTRRTRIFEKLLQANDDVYAMGALTNGTTSDEANVRHLRIDSSGRRVLVSTFSRAQLVLMEQLYAGSGGALFALIALALAWMYVQRFHVSTMPGTLS